TVGEDAAAAKAGPNEVAVDVGVDQVVRRRDLGARLVPGQVTARVRCSGVELQCRERQFLEARHACGNSMRIVRQSGAGLRTSSSTLSRNAARGTSRAASDAR